MLPGAAKRTHSTVSGLTCPLIGRQGPRHHKHLIPGQPRIEQQDRDQQRSCAQHRSQDVQQAGSAAQAVARAPREAGLVQAGAAGDDRQQVSSACRAPQTWLVILQHEAVACLANNLMCSNIPEIP